MRPRSNSARASSDSPSIAPNSSSARADFVLRQTVQRDRFRTAGPGADQRAAHRVLRPKAPKRPVVTAKEPALAVPALANAGPEIRAKREHDLDRVAHLDVVQRGALGRRQR